MRQKIGETGYALIQAGLILILVVLILLMFFYL